jgi:hypothetical protein
MTDVVKKWITDWAAVAFTGTQTMASLTNDEWTSLSDEINNISLGRAIYCDFDLSLGSAAFTGADSAVELYLLAPGSGDVYPDWTDNVTTDEQENNAHHIGAFTTSGATLAQRLYLRDVELPPGKFSLGVRNRSNVTMNATNTLYYRLWSHGSS